MVKFIDPSSLYRCNDACGRVNEMYTDWFSVEEGVRAGDNLSPTLFGLLVNDLVMGINSLSCGIKLGNIKFYSYYLYTVYVDDIVFLADSQCNR